jgi:predicted transcriptional regulator
MEVHLDPDVQAKLNRLADERFVDYDAWFIREVEEGLVQIERGQVLSHAEAGTRLEKLLAKKQSCA